MMVSASPAWSGAGREPASGAAAAKTNATEAGTAWLSLVDAAQYSQSWDDASALFREKVSRDQWIEKAKAARTAVGPLRDRTFASATYVDGDSGPTVVLLWNSRFDAMPEAVEQVTVMLDGGTWRVAGYFVRSK
jgi:hypothetical protein